MQGDGIATTVMLGLPGFVVLAVSEYAGELEQAVETTAGQGWCPGCGVHARLHDRGPPPVGRRTPTGTVTPGDQPRRPDDAAEVGWVGDWRGDVVAFRFQPPPVDPGMRFSRTRLTDVLHRRCSTGARQGRFGLGR